MKRCPHCKTEKDNSKFSKASLSNDGLASWCKECVREYKYGYSQLHKDEMAEYQRQYNQAHRKEKAERHQQYYQEHKDNILKYVAQYQREHREEHNEHVRKYDRSHPEVHQTNKARRRALIYESEGTFTTSEWLQMLEDCDYTCKYCGIQTYKLTMDHVIPLSKGGVHNASNIVPACKPCNLRKGTKDLDEFLNELRVS